MDVAKAIYYLDEECRRALPDGYGPIDRPRWPQTLDLYHLYFVLELWCWMAQIGQSVGRAAQFCLAQRNARLTGIRRAIDWRG
jgi:hypothetical protein